MRAITKSMGNGLKVIVNSTPQLQTVGIAFGVNFGSIDEKPGINGSAHFLEHMLFKGTAKRTWKEISDQLKEMGVYNNAFTDHETTVYFMQAYKGYFDTSMEIFSDMVKNSKFPQKEFELERGPIINENLIRHDNPRFLISDYMPRVLYKKHPAHMSVGGDNEKTISKIRRNDLLDIYNNYYTPRNSVLSIYGSGSPEKAFCMASKYFGDFKRSYRSKTRHIAKEKQEKKTLTISRKGIKQTRIGIGFKCSEFSKARIDEFLALTVVERYLDDKLFEELRQKRGLSYDPMAMYNPYSTFSFIAAAAGIEHSKLDEAKEIILKEYSKLEDGEINLDDLKRTKKAIVVQEKLRRDSTGGMAVETASYELMYGGSKLLYALPELINKVSLDDVRKYSAKYIDTDKYGMILLKPQ